MKDNYTHITLIVDRSGSMDGVKAEAEGGVNAFLKEQQEFDGEATLLLRDFDTEHRTCYDGGLEWFPSYGLEPRGMTALYDAVGLGIKMTGESLGALTEEERPAKVVFVIQTDGWENSSHEYTATQVHDLIKEHEEKYSWEFVFLGMGADSWGGAQTLGIQNFTQAAGSGDAYMASYSNLGQVTNSFRAGGQSMAGARAVVDEEGNVTQQQ